MSARCQLARAELGAVDERLGTLVVLHADGADCTELITLCSSAAPTLDLVAPQAPRARDPFHSSAPPEHDPRLAAYAGFSWFRTDDAGRPEPASFGDSLAQLEALVLELAERGGAPLYLLGRGTGATLALGAAQAFPDLLAGVVALDGAPPEIPGWSEHVPIPLELPVVDNLRGVLPWAQPKPRS
jgi:predicted esterase